MSVTVLVSFNVKEAHQQSFESLMEGVRSALPEVEGCQSVSVYQGSDNPLQFRVVERWESRSLHQSHIDSLIVSGKWQNVLDSLTTEPEAIYCRAL